MKHYSTCVYCEMPLSRRHEHDHMPIPARHGGTSVFCVCINCHDLKDRMTLEQMPASVVGELMGLFATATPVQRILIGKLCALVCDAAKAAK